MPPRTEPALWQVETDRGITSFEVESEDSIYRREPRQVSIVDVRGIRYLIPDTKKLDLKSQRGAGAVSVEGEREREIRRGARLHPSFVAAWVVIQLVLSRFLPHFVRESCAICRYNRREAIMLLRFTFSNFRSFRTEQELSMIAGPLKDRADTLVHDEAIPESVLPTAAIYGANASGKTNVLLALQFMAAAVRFSHTRWQPDEKIPREPFASEQDRELPSEFMADVLIGGVRYQYGFSVTDTAVLEEWLHAYPKGKRQAWFARQVGKPMSFSEKMPGENRTIEGLMRPNSLFLSTAAQNNHSALSPIYGWFSKSLSFVLGGRAEWKQRSAELCADPRYRDSVVKMVAFADLGILDLRFIGKAPPEGTKHIASAVERATRGTLSAVEAAISSELRIALPGPNENRKEVRLLHRLEDKVVPFEPNQESDGTIAYLTLLGPMISAIQDGGVVCVDELDASLHPLLAIHLIQLFGDRSLNPKGAQLVFNTHDTNLLSSGVLRRDQIWFAEKKQGGSSQIYPLTDFKPRKEENLENGYLQGRYGAIPFLNPQSLPSTELKEHEEA